ncbi:hypothetical protein ACWGB8_24035 [Kitasatospora sp. NPDC054939]
MPVEMIPDRPGREAAFEPLLDELVAILCPDWTLPERLAQARPDRRCEHKRREVGHAAEADPDAARLHADLLLRAAVHDHCRSGIDQLVEPLVRALGHRPLQEALVHYVRTGTDAEKSGATMAWSFAQPPLRYCGEDVTGRGIATVASVLARHALADVRTAYDEAVLAAFLACEDPGTRQDLARWIDLAPARYPAEPQPDRERARGIMLADPEHYRSALGRRGC